MVLSHSLVTAQCKLLFSYEHRVVTLRNRNKQFPVAMMWRLTSSQLLHAWWIVIFVLCLTLHYFGATLYLIMVLRVFRSISCPCKLAVLGLLCTLPVGILKADLLYGKNILVLLKWEAYGSGLIEIAVKQVVRVSLDQEHTKGCFLICIWLALSCRLVVVLFQHWAQQGIFEKNIA